MSHPSASMCVDDGSSCPGAASTATSPYMRFVTYRSLEQEKKTLIKIWDEK